MSWDIRTEYDRVQYQLAYRPDVNFRGMTHRWAMRLWVQMSCRQGWIRGGVVPVDQKPLPGVAATPDDIRPTDVSV